MTNPFEVQLHRQWARDIDAATLYELLKLRAEIFVQEQQSAYTDPDGRDLEADARHLWLTNTGGAVIATLRLLEDHADGVTSFRIGRLCTTPSERGKGYTTRLLQTALADVGSAACKIDAQTYLVDMYRKHGFVVEGEEYLLDGIPHVAMHRDGGKPWSR